MKKTSLALIALCALLAAVPQPGRAAEIDRPIPAWPLVYHSGDIPLYSYFDDEKRDALSWSLFWFLFSYESEGEFAQHTDFPWKVITCERKDEETYDFRFLWRFIRKSKTATSSTFEFNPFYYYEEEEGKGSYWAVLGELLGVETTEDQRKKLRLSWIF